MKLASFAMAAICLLVGSALNAQNTPPAITVMSGMSNVPDETAVTVAPNDTVAALNLTITIDDANNDTVDVDVAVSNVTTQGVNPAEWSTASAQAVSFTLTPTSGSFNVADVEHTIVLTANDGTETTTFTIFVVVSAATGNSTPWIVLQSADTYIAERTAVPIPYNTQVAALGLEARALDADGDALTISIAVSNFTTQGLNTSEWTASNAPSGAELTPATGQFNVGDVPHVVSLTISDGTVSATYHWILLIGPDGTTSSNAAPFIGLFAGDAYIGNGATVPVPFNTQVSALGLALIVADYEGDSTSASLDGVSNFTTQGLVPAEWQSTAAATPYTLSPTSGQFNVAGIDHVVTLSANDGTITAYSFTLRIGNAGGSSDDDDDDGCSTGTGGFSWILLAALLAAVAAGLRQAVRRS